MWPLLSQYLLFSSLSWCTLVRFDMCWTFVTTTDVLCKTLDSSKMLPVKLQLNCRTDLLHWDCCMNWLYIFCKELLHWSCRSDCDNWGVMSVKSYQYCWTCNAGSQLASRTPVAPNFMSTLCYRAQLRCSLRTLSMVSSERNGLLAL